MNRDSVTSDPNLLSCVLSFIDPRYEMICARLSELNNLEFNCDYCFVMLQTFKSLHHEIYGNHGVKTVRIFSLKSKAVISLLLCKWCIQMGIGVDGISLCSLICRSRANHLQLLRDIVVDFPNWQPCMEDLIRTNAHGNLNLLEWLGVTYANVHALMHAAVFSCGRNFYAVYSIGFFPMKFTVFSGDNAFDSTFLQYDVDTRRLQALAGPWEYDFYFSEDYNSIVSGTCVERFGDITWIYGPDDMQYRKFFIFIEDAEFDNDYDDDGDYIS